MSQLLFKVDGVFDITGRGVVLTPGVDGAGPLRVRVGDPLELRLPDGSSRRTVVRGLEILCGPVECYGVPILVGVELTKAPKTAGLP